MKLTLYKELQEAEDFDKKHNLGFWGGRTHLVQVRIDNTRTEVANGIFKICTNCGVLPSESETSKYQEKVLNGELSLKQALTEFKNGFRN